MRIKEALAYTVIFSLIFISAILLRGTTVYDINLHTASAHIAYKIIVEHDPLLSQHFNVNFLKPASVYHIYYVIVYSFLHSSFLTVALFYFIYFILWGVGSFYLLKNVGRLNEILFVAFLLLSLNPGIAYGMPSFMIAESIYLILLSKVIDFFNKGQNKPLFIFILISSFFLFILHPLVSLLFIFTSAFYLSFDKTKGIANIYTYVIVVFFISIILFLIYIVLSSSSLSVFDRMKGNNLIHFIVFDVFLSKFVTIVLINNIFFFTVFIPLLIMFLFEKGHWNYHLRVVYILLILTLIIPEQISYSFLLAGRFLPFILIFVILSFPYNKKYEEFYKLILYLVLILNALLPFLYPMVSDNIYSKYILGFLFHNKQEDLYDGVIDPILRNMNATRVYSGYVGSLYGLTFYEIDRGVLSSYIYASPEHPVSHKNITTIFEINAKRIKLDFTQEREINRIKCSIIASQLESICSLYDYVVLVACNLNLTKIAEVEEDGGNILIYKC